MFQKDICKTQNRVHLAYYRDKDEHYTYHGGRLRKDALFFAYMGENFHQIRQTLIREVLTFSAQELKGPEEAKVAGRPLKEIRN